jgi:hypothetical protein
MCGRFFRTKEAQEVYERALFYDSNNPDIYYNVSIKLINILGIWHSILALMCYACTKNYNITGFKRELRSVRGFSGNQKKKCMFFSSTGIISIICQRHLIKNFKA